MQDNQDYILGICQTLSMQGKKPTVALVRSRANRALMIPHVIKALQAWKQNPQHISVSNNTPEPDNTGALPSSAQHIGDLEQRIVALEQQVAQMAKQLLALSKVT